MNMIMTIVSSTKEISGQQQYHRSPF
jgi:hypothetical protein